MRVEFEYADKTWWKGNPDDAHLSPDKGLVRMYAYDDFEYCLTFTYQDIYYLYPEAGGWLFGADSPKREFILMPGQMGCEGKELPFKLPPEAVIRHGETVSQEDAVFFRLIESVDEKILHDKRRIETCKDCDE